MFKTAKYFVLLLLAGLFIQGCDGKKKEVAIESITQAEVDISSAKNAVIDKNSKLTITEAEKKISEAKNELSKKNYNKARILAEQASQEIKAVIAKTKELKESGKQKLQKKRNNQLG